MDLNNFYTGFGILLVYFTLVWQINRGKGIETLEKANALITVNAEVATKDNWNSMKKEIVTYLLNPLYLTTNIISITGIIAFTMLICGNWRSLSLSPSTVVLLSITLMHLVISIDLWLLNFKLFYKIKEIHKHPSNPLKKTNSRKRG